MLRYVKAKSSFCPWILQNCRTKKTTASDGTSLFNVHAVDQRRETNDSLGRALPVRSLAPQSCSNVLVAYRYSNANSGFDLCAVHLHKLFSHEIVVEGELLTQVVLKVKIMKHDGHCIYEPCYHCLVWGFRQEPASRNAEKHASTLILWRTRSQSGACCSVGKTKVMETMLEKWLCWLIEGEHEKGGRVKTARFGFACVLARFRTCGLLGKELYTQMSTNVDARVSQSTIAIPRWIINRNKGIVRALVVYFYEFSTTEVWNSFAAIELSEGIAIVTESDETRLLELRCPPLPKALSNPRLSSTVAGCPSELH